MHGGGWGEGVSHWSSFIKTFLSTAVELPFADASLEAGSCPRHWEHGGYEGRRADAADRALRGQSH